VSKFRIGVIGDLHTHWDHVDVAQFDRSDYDLLLFTGDLGGGTAESSLRVAKVMARLGKPALVMPGNNDTGDTAELAAELAYRSGVKSLFAVRRGDGLAADDNAAPPIRLCGYSTHRITRERVDFTLIAGRPHSMGGSELSFPEHMDSNYGVDSIEASRKRLFELVDEAETANIVFLSHNGPAGLGERSHDIWGCDFRPGGGDWGDPDLSAAVDYASRVGKRVLAVIAGHMHLHTKCGNVRPWRVERSGTVYVNAARVPRIFAMGSIVHRHHVALDVTDEGIEVSEMLVPERSA